LKEITQTYKYLSPEIISEENVFPETYDLLNKIIQESSVNNLTNIELDALQFFLESKGAKFSKKLRHSELDKEFREVLVTITEIDVEKYIKLSRKKFVNTREEDKKNRKKFRSRVKYFCACCEKKFKTSKKLKTHIISDHSCFKSSNSGTNSKNFRNVILNNTKPKKSKKSNHDKIGKDFTPSTDAIWFRYPGSFEGNT